MPTVGPSRPSARDSGFCLPFRDDRCEPRRGFHTSLGRSHPCNPRWVPHQIKRFLPVLLGSCLADTVRSLGALQKRAEGEANDEEQLDRAIGSGHSGLLAWRVRSDGPWQYAKRVGGDRSTGRDRNRKRTAGRQPRSGQPSAQPELSGSSLMARRPDRFGNDLLRVLVDDGLELDTDNRTDGGLCDWRRLGAESRRCNSQSGFSVVTLRVSSARIFVLILGAVLTHCPWRRLAAIKRPRALFSFLNAGPPCQRARGNGARP